MESSEVMQATAIVILSGYAVFMTVFFVICKITVSGKIHKLQDGMQELRKQVLG